MTSASTSLPPRAKAGGVWEGSVGGLGGRGRVGSGRICHPRRMIKLGKELRLAHAGRPSEVPTIAVTHLWVPDCFHISFFALSISVCNSNGSIVPGNKQGIRHVEALFSDLREEKPTFCGPPSNNPLHAPGWWFCHIRFPASQRAVDRFFREAGTSLSCGCGSMGTAPTAPKARRWPGGQVTAGPAPGGPTAFWTLGTFGHEKAVENCWLFFLVGDRVFYTATCLGHTRDPSWVASKGNQEETIQHVDWMFARFRLVSREANWRTEIHKG